jgi:hypothetical protein
MYVVGVIRGIVYDPAAAPPAGDATAAAAAAGGGGGGGGAPPAPLPRLQNIFAANGNFAPEIQLFIIHSPDDIDRLGFGNTQIIFRIWVPHNMTVGQAFREALQQALANPGALHHEIYGSRGGHEVQPAIDAGTYFSNNARDDYDSPLRLIAQRAYGGRLTAVVPLIREYTPPPPPAHLPHPGPQNFYPNIHDVGDQGRFRFNVGLLYRGSFQSLYHTEPKFLRNFGQRLGIFQVQPLAVFPRFIIGISKIPMCELCTRLLLNYFINEQLMAEDEQIRAGAGEMAPRRRNIIILSRDLAGLNAEGVDRGNNIFLQAGLDHAAVIREINIKLIVPDPAIGATYSTHLLVHLFDV